MSRATGFEFLAGRLEDLGYAQWGGGYVTSALWGVPSVLNIERKGYWKFGIASPSPTLNLIEFHSQAMAVGYSNMNMTKESARILLDALAANGPRARTFRGKIGEVATSYRCPNAGSDGGCADSESANCIRCGPAFLLILLNGYKCKLLSQLPSSNVSRLLR